MSIRAPRFVTLCPVYWASLYGLGSGGIWLGSRQGQENFLFCKASSPNVEPTHQSVQAECGVHPSSYSMGTEGSLTDVKRPGGEVVHSPPSSVEFMNWWCCTTTGGIVSPLVVLYRQWWCCTATSPYALMAFTATNMNLSLISQVTVNRTVFSGNMGFRDWVSGILQLHFLCSVTDKYNSDNLNFFFYFPLPPSTKSALGIVSV